MIDHLNNDWVTIMICNYVKEIALNQTKQANTAKQILPINQIVLANYKEPDLNGHFDDCTKDVLKELYVQEEEMSDSDEESAEVDDK